MGVDDACRNGGTAQASPVFRLGLIGAAIALATWAGPFIHHQLGSFAFGPLTIVCAAGAAWAFHITSRSSSAGLLWIVLGIAAAMRLGMLFVEPYFSSDLYRYIWDGRYRQRGSIHTATTRSPSSILPDENLTPDQPGGLRRTITRQPRRYLLLIKRFGESALVIKAACSCSRRTIAASSDFVVLGRPAAGVVAYSASAGDLGDRRQGHIDAAM